MSNSMMDDSLDTVGSAWSETLLTDGVHILADSLSTLSAVNSPVKNEGIVGGLAREKKTTML